MMTSILSQPDPGVMEMSASPLLLLAVVVGALMMIGVSSFVSRKVK